MPSKHPYDMKTPCDNCPFRKKGGIRLAADSRVVEVAMGDGNFPCHKTTEECETNDGDSDLQATKRSKVCAGFMIFRENIEHPNQMMRIAERLRMYDAKELLTGNKAVGEVFKSLRAMVNASRRDRNENSRKRS